MRFLSWLKSFLPWFERTAPPPVEAPAPPPRQVVISPEQLAPAYAILDEVQQAGKQLSAMLLEHEIAKAKLIATITSGDARFDQAIEKLRNSLDLPTDVDYTLNLPEKRSDRALFVRDPAKK